MLPVSLADVQSALPRVREVLTPTLLNEWPGLSQQFGCRLYLKHENHQPVGAFKVRGGVNLVSSLTPAEREAGLLACSTGNHGQSLAFACSRAGVRCAIVVPEGNNPGKNRAIRLLGAELIEHGRDFDEARDHVETVLQPERRSRYVHSANEPALIAGVATMALEVFEVLPEPDVILVPIGLGSGVCGTSIVAKALRPETQVIGVQAEQASGVARAWQSGTMQPGDSAATWAEGMATRVPASMTMAIMRELMDDVVLVSEEQLRQACWSILTETHNLAEGAGAAAVAAVAADPGRFAGKKVVAVLSGGNLDLTELPSILAAGRNSVTHG
ncbi:MAG: threonine dehydratase [Planctomycetaceae bacterium]|nr:threonine dehydratase [Planctomycetaceae bacterium]